MAAKKKTTKPNGQRQDILKYIQLAIETEKRGIKFYTDAKSKIDDYSMTRLMDVLLEQEYIHLKYFTQVYDDEKKKGTDDAAKKAGTYKKQPSIKNPLFGMDQLAKVTKQKSTIYHLFSQAIDFEQKGHDLYMDLARKIKSKRISDFLKQVAHEELKHRDFIQMHQEAIYNTSYWLGMEHVRLQT
jgi:rubrerythrin